MPGQDAGGGGHPELRRLETAALSGEVVVPPNCGQELYDVVEITHAPSGLAAARRRVVGLTLEFTRQQRPRYRQHLRLQGL